VRQFSPRPAASVAALATAALVVTSAPAALGSAAARPTARLPAVPLGAGGTPRSVLLINGDRLIAAPAAADSRVLGIVPASPGHPAGPMLALGLGHNAFEIPQVALPYLGHGLNPDLFSVGSLLRVGPDGRLPVTVGYTGRVPSLPGVTLTQAAGGTARGYLTAAGAAAFGAALARQFAADHARGSYGQDGMFAGGVSVGLAGAGAQASQPSPAFPMHTLTVTGTNLAGKPDTGDEVFVFNADNANLTNDPFQNVNIFYHGVTKFSLPAGHYWAVGAFETNLRSVRKFTDHSVILPQFTLAGNSTTVHMAARAADSQVQMVTPRPAVPSPFNVEFEVRHPTPAGPVGALEWLGGRLFFSPTTRRPTVGSLQTYVFDQLNSPPTAAGTPYQYNLAYADTSGLIHSQRHVVRPAGLATVHSRYYSDVNTTGYYSRFGFFPANYLDAISAVVFLPMPVPRRRTEYMGGSPGAVWADSYQQSYQYLAGGQIDDLRIFHAGEQLAENWNAYPLHEGYNTNLIGAANLAPAIPSATRAGDMLTLDVMPFSDSTLGHISASGFFGALQLPFGKITGHFEIGENGKVIASGNPVQGDKEVGPAGEFHDTVTLSPRPATIRLVLDASRTAKIYTISTVSHTVWTWRSRHESGARLPAGWGCVLARNGTVSGRSCAVEPMMTLEYAVAGESLHGSTRPGPQVVHLSVGHLQLVKGPRVTRASMSVSFDGGKTWHPATVTGHGGSYTAAFTAPAGVKVSLRTSAADAASGSVTETLTNAYQISP
jgi:hypothetical protein